MSHSGDRCSSLVTLHSIKFSGVAIMGKTAAELTVDERRYYASILKHRPAAIPAGDRESALAAARKIADLLKDDFGATGVWLFGSLSGGTFCRHSDIDVAVMGVSDELFYRCVAMAESMAPPFEIDVLDLDHCPGNLRESVLSEGIPL
jgi:predicted nucleotidyltransferase